jgi:hypothetical protein
MRLYVALSGPLGIFNALLAHFTRTMGTTWLTRNFAFSPSEDASKRMGQSYGWNRERSRTAATRTILPSFNCNRVSHLPILDRVQIFGPSRAMSGRMGVSNASATWPARCCASNAPEVSLRRDESHYRDKSASEVARYTKTRDQKLLAESAVGRLKQARRRQNGVHRFGFRVTRQNAGLTLVGMQLRFLRLRHSL